MKISWMTPFHDEPKLVAGMILESADALTGDFVWIPIPLEFAPMDEVTRKDAKWLLSQIPEHFFTFNSLKSAEIFLFWMFENRVQGTLTFDAMMQVAGQLDAGGDDKKNLVMVIDKPGVYPN